MVMRETTTLTCRDRCRDAQNPMEPGAEDLLGNLMLTMCQIFVSNLILLPQRQLRLLLFQFLGTVHHKVDDVDAASEGQQHQDVG